MTVKAHGAAGSTDTSTIAHLAALIAAASMSTAALGVLGQSPAASGPAPATQTRPTSSAAADVRLRTAWSEPVRGLTVRLEAYPALFHPGDVVVLSGHARNVAGGKVRVTGIWLHVVTPDGEHRVYRYPEARGTEVHQLPEGTTLSFANWHIRLVRAATGWRGPGDQKAEDVPLDLSRPGTCTFWYAEGTNRPPPDGVASPPPIVSPRLKIEVRELVESEMARQLTAAQRDDLRMLAEGPDQHNAQASQAIYRLKKDLEVARNVGLADAATALLIEEAGKPGRLRYPMKLLWEALEARAVHGGHPPQLAIAGDHIRPLAELEFRQLKAWYEVKPPKGPPFTEDGPSVSVLRALCLESRDEPLRKPLADLAKANAMLLNPAPWDKDDGSTVLIRFHHNRLGLAWILLSDLGVLIGMTEAEVIAILGQPTSRRKDMLDWYAGSSMHVNPHIWVVVADGKVQSVGGG